jgi:hypothetical protein
MSENHWELLILLAENASTAERHMLAKKRGGDTI